MEQNKLDELLELTKENNKILRGLRRAQRWAFVGRIFYWCIIIAITAGAYYYIQPYLKQVAELYGQSQETVLKLQNIGSSIPNITDLQSLLGGKTK